jgi:prepilin-type N-terminal cleavage/methylation domain-containing protein
MRSTNGGLGRAGFTLIELLIVVVIIGILASIAIPKFGATKEKAYVAKLKSDLRNLATAQEAYYYDNQSYYSGVVPNPGALAFDPSAGVSIVISGVTATGWGATATHVSAPGRACAIFFGPTVLAPATVEGEVACN